MSLSKEMIPSVAGDEDVPCAAKMAGRLHENAAESANIRSACGLIIGVTIVFRRETISLNQNAQSALDYVRSRTAPTFWPVHVTSSSVFGRKSLPACIAANRRDPSRCAKIISLL